MRNDNNSQRFFSLHFGLILFLASRLLFENQFSIRSVEMMRRMSGKYITRHCFCRCNIVTQKSPFSSRFLCAQLFSIYFLLYQTEMIFHLFVGGSMCSWLGAPNQVLTLSLSLPISLTSTASSHEDIDTGTSAYGTLGILGAPSLYFNPIIILISMVIFYLAHSDCRLLIF